MMVQLPSAFLNNLISSVAAGRPSALCYFIRSKKGSTACCCARCCKGRAVMSGKENIRGLTGRQDWARSACVYGVLHSRYAKLGCVPRARAGELDASIHITDKPSIMAAFWCMLATCAAHRAGMICEPAACAGADYTSSIK